MTGYPTENGEKISRRPHAAAGNPIRFAERLDSIDDSAERDAAFRALVRLVELDDDQAEICRPVESPGNLVAMAWLEEWEKLGGTCQVKAGPRATGWQRTFALIPVPPNGATPTEIERLDDMRQRLDAENLRTRVLTCLIYRGDLDSLLAASESSSA